MFIMKKTLFITLCICVLGLVTTNPAYAGKHKKDKGDSTVSTNAAAILAQYDTDKDGQLSDSEIDALKKDFEANKPEILKQYDVNSDGKLDDSEIATLKSSLTAPAPSKHGKHGKKKKSDSQSSDSQSSQ